MSRLALAAVCAAGLGMVALAEQPQSLEPAELGLNAVVDSGTYFIFDYSLANPWASSSAVAWIRLDVGATSGTPAALPATGTFRNATVLPGATTPLEPHAQVGPISPTDWWAGLGRDGHLQWYAPSSGSVDVDSVAPGSVRPGFGLRTTYLPGLSEVVALPTWQSCCSTPDTVALEFPRRSTFAVTSAAVAPRFMPSEVTIELVQFQLASVCNDPLWIDDDALCNQLTDSLDAAEARLIGSNFPGARGALEGVLAILENEREPAGPIEGNAYWLLKVNTEHVLGTIPGGPVITPVSADTYLRQGNPNQNQGTETLLSLRASGRHRALLRADLPSATGPVASARLEFDIVLNAENWGTSGRTIDAHRMLVAWTEPGATWNCPNDTNPTNSSANCPGAAWEMFTLSPSPYVAAASGSLVVTNGLTGTTSIDVTVDVQAMLSGQVVNHGWIVRKTDEGAEGRIEIASSETASGPRLVIEMGAP